MAPAPPRVLRRVTWRVSMTRQLALRSTGVLLLMAATVSVLISVLQAGT